MIKVKVTSVFCVGFDPVQQQYKVMLWQNYFGRLTATIQSNAVAELLWETNSANFH